VFYSKRRTRGRRSHIGSKNGCGLGNTVLRADWIGTVLEAIIGSLVCTVGVRLVVTETCPEIEAKLQFVSLNIHSHVTLLTATGLQI
jgi:hypothetical protein